MQMANTPLDDIFRSIGEDVSGILSTMPVPLETADPPNTLGVYILRVENEVMYVGEAKGSKGLRDRLLSKHISGDDNHAVQRAFKEDFPDRQLRRAHIKKTVFAQWREIEHPDRVSAVERTLIWMFSPPWNRK